MSEIKVNSIKGTGASTAAITIDSSSGGCTANITNRPNRNLIINGTMLVAQRGTSTTSNNGYYTIDRIHNYCQGTDENPTISQVDVASGNVAFQAGLRKALRITNGNQSSGAGAADQIQIEYRVEATDIAQSGWNYLSSSSFLTLSFYIKSSVAQAFNFFVKTEDGTAKNMPFSTPSLTADTWTRVSVQIKGDSGITFDNDNGKGLVINLSPFLGTNYTDNSITNGEWITYASGTRYKDVTSTWYTTNDATLEFTGLQLELGSVASDFELKTKQEEYRRCCRYFEKSYEIDTAPGTSTTFPGSAFLVAGTSGAGNATSGSRNFREEKRATPTMAGYGINNVANAGKWYFTKNGGNGHATMTFNVIGKNQFQAYVDVGQSNNASSITGHWTADAEL